MNDSWYCNIKWPWKIFSKKFLQMVGMIDFTLEKKILLLSTEIKSDSSELFDIVIKICFK